MLQLTSTFETRILQILLLIFNDLPLGITVTFLKKILLDTSNPSSLQMPETTLVTLQHLIYLPQSDVEQFSFAMPYHKS